jgi:hypothetical protein
LEHLLFRPCFNPGKISPTKKGGKKMKQKRFNKKLVIKKVTISNLSNEELLSIRGGTEGTLECPVGGTVHGRTCDQFSTVATCQ